MRQIHLVDDRIYETLDANRKAFIDVVRNHDTDLLAAETLGVHPSNVSRRVGRILATAASKHGLVRGHPEMPIAEGKILGKMTTHLKDGKVTDVWYRQNDQYAELMEAL